MNGPVAHSTEKILPGPTTKADEKVHDHSNGNDNTGESADGSMIVLKRHSRSSDIFVNAPSSKGGDVPAAAGLVQAHGVNEDQEENKTTIDAPVKLITNGEIDHDYINGVLEDDKIDPQAQALETEETDKRQYVGDGTWEEKTWKELVRLREDMFWARIGGFRG